MKILSARPLTAVSSGLSPCAACEVRAVALCGALDDHELARMDAISTPLKFAPGQMIVQEKDDANSVYNVLSGHVKLYKLLSDGRRQITGFLLPGDFIGISALDTHEYAAEAMDSVTLCRFPRVSLNALLTEYPYLMQRMLDIVSHDLAQAQAHAVLLGRKTARERVCSFLLALSRRSLIAKQRATEPPSIALAMSRADIADYLGLTIETVSRTFTALKRAGVIAIPSRNEIEIRMPARIEIFAEGA